MLELMVAKDSVIQCSYGSFYSVLTILSDCEVNLASPPLATEKMHWPIQNILPFYMCSSWYNPMVLNAGLNLKPKPLIPFVDPPIPQYCIPMTFTAWEDASPTTTINGDKALTMCSKCKCLWEGEITPVFSSQFVAWSIAAEKKLSK